MRVRVWVKVVGKTNDNIIKIIKNGQKNSQSLDSPTV